MVYVCPLWNNQNCMNWYNLNKIHTVGCNKLFLDSDLCNGADSLTLAISREPLEFLSIEECALREGGFPLRLIGPRTSFWLKPTLGDLSVFVESFLNTASSGALLVDFVRDVSEFKYAYGVILDPRSVTYVERDIESDVIVVGVSLMLLAGIRTSGDGSLGGRRRSPYFGVLMLAVALLPAFIQSVTSSPDLNAIDAILFWNGVLPALFTSFIPIAESIFLLVSTSIFMSRNSDRSLRTRMLQKRANSLV